MGAFLRRSIAVALALFSILISEFSAAAALGSPPCAPLPAAASPDFEARLDGFLNALCYQQENWQHDAQVRTTNGLHPFVKVWYSPPLWTWMTAGDRTAQIPDGAIANRLNSPPSPPHGRLAATIFLSFPGETKLA